MSDHRTPFRAWHAMSGREQAVWGACYAASRAGGVEAAVQADRAIASRASLTFPEAESPEHRAARLGRSLTLEQFHGWYTVELSLTRRGMLPHMVTDDEVRTAYETYVMCSNDFY
jgi:hypothetical protein